MLQFALALAPDLADVVSILCQEERRQSDSQSFHLCMHRYWYLYIYIYISYTHIVLLVQARGGGVESVLRASVICLFLRAEGGRSPH